MFDLPLRNLKDRILAGLIRPMVDKIHPNMVSIVAFVLGMASVVFLGLGQIGLAFGFWLVNRIVDGIDGLLARMSNQVTDFGGYLDIMLDFVVYAAIPLALVVLDQNQELLFPTLVMMASFYINGASWMYLSAILEKRGRSSEDQTKTSVVMPSGLVEGAETIIIYSLLILIPEARYFLLWATAALTILGIVLRFSWAFRLLTKKSSVV